MGQILKNAPYQVTLNPCPGLLLPQWSSLVPQGVKLMGMNVKPQIRSSGQCLADFLLAPSAASFSEFGPANQKQQKLAGKGGTMSFLTKAWNSNRWYHSNGSP